MSEMIDAGLKNHLFRAILRIAVYGFAAFYMLASDINHGFDAGFTFSKANGYGFAQFVLFVSMFELGMLTTYMRHRGFYLGVIVCMGLTGIWFLREATVVEIKKQNAAVIAAPVCP